MQDKTIRKGDVVLFTVVLDLIGKRNTNIPAILARGMVSKVDNKEKKFSVHWMLESYPKIGSIIPSTFSVEKMLPGKAELDVGEAYFHESSKAGISTWVIQAKRKSRTNIGASARLSSFVESSFMTANPDYIDYLANKYFTSILFGGVVETDFGNIGTTKLSLEYIDNQNPPRSGTARIYFNKMTLPEGYSPLLDVKFLTSLKSLLKEYGFCNYAVNEIIPLFFTIRDKTAIVGKESYFEFSVGPIFLSEWFDMIQGPTNNLKTKI